MVNAPYSDIFILDRLSGDDIMGAGGVVYG